MQTRKLNRRRLSFPLRHATYLLPLLVCLWWPVNAASVSQKALSIVGKVEQFLDYPSGLVRGKMTIIHNTGRTKVLNFDLYKNHENSLYIFNSRRRGLEKKILYNENGEVIWVFDALNKTLYQKRESEKFSSAVDSGYSYVDMSFYSLRQNYSPRLTGTENFEGRDYTRVELVPNRPQVYSRIIMLVDEKNGYRPIRFDFLDRNKLLLKSMTFQFATMRTRGSAQRTIYNTRRHLIHLHSGTISIMEMFSADMTVKPDPAIYQNRNLNK